METLHHRRVLCRTSHSGFWVIPSTDGLDVTLYVGFWVELSQKVPYGTFIKGPTRYQKGFEGAEEPFMVLVSTFISQSVLY